MLTRILAPESGGLLSVRAAGWCLDAQLERGALPAGHYEERVSQV